MLCSSLCSTIVKVLKQGIVSTPPLPPRSPKSIILPHYPPGFPLPSASPMHFSRGRYTCLTYPISHHSFNMGFYEFNPLTSWKPPKRSCCGLLVHLLAISRVKLHFHVATRLHNSLELSLPNNYPTCSSLPPGASLPSGHWLHGLFDHTNTGILQTTSSCTTIV